MKKTLAVVALLGLSSIVAHAEKVGGAQKKASDSATPRAAESLLVDLAEVTAAARRKPLFQVAKQECWCSVYEYQPRKVCVDWAPNGSCRIHKTIEVEVCVKEHCHNVPD